MNAKVIDLAARLRQLKTEAALGELRRIDKKHLLKYAEDFEAQAAQHPAIKTRLATRLAALLRALAEEQTP